MHNGDEWWLMVMATPLSLAGLFHGRCHLEMDDQWGYPYDLRNLHVGKTGCHVYQPWQWWTNPTNKKHGDVGDGAVMALFDPHDYCLRIVMIWKKNRHLFWGCRSILTPRMGPMGWWKHVQRMVDSRFFSENVFVAGLRTLAAKDAWDSAMILLNKAIRPYQSQDVSVWKGWMGICSNFDNSPKHPLHLTLIQVCRPNHRTPYDLSVFVFATRKVKGCR